MKVTFDYTKLIDKIYLENLNVEKVSTALGISERDWIRRIAGVEEFTQMEITSLAELLNIAPSVISEYFFEVLS